LPENFRPGSLPFTGVRLLTINAGSSSVRVVLMDLDGASQRRASWRAGMEPAEIDSLLRRFLADDAGDPVGAVAHRVVHGGQCLVRSCLITADVEAEIERLVPLAPLHNPAALAWIRATREVLGQLPQIAVFDTAFYANLPQVASTYALAPALRRSAEVRRYGFHGLAHQAMWQRWSELRQESVEHARVISLQLGSGCSITATCGGHAVDTSMGFSPLEGLVMATRSGDVDPGLLLYLQRTLSISPERMEQLLNHDSGLLGVSVASADMRELLASDAAAARLAVELFCYRARKYIGAYLAVLGGAEAILFGGGVGENTPEVRERILTGMEWAGIKLDSATNRGAVGVEARINASPDRDSGHVAIWVIPVDEAHILAAQARAVLAGRIGIQESSS
jgi:acetate kinase